MYINIALYFQFKGEDRVKGTKQGKEVCTSLTQHTCFYLVCSPSDEVSADAKKVVSGNDCLEQVYKYLTLCRMQLRISKPRLRHCLLSQVKVTVGQLNLSRLH